MMGNVIIAGGDVAPTTPRRDEMMEIGTIVSITKDRDRHVCEEMEPRVNYDKLVGDGVDRDAYTGEELEKELVTNGRKKEMQSMEEFEVFDWVPLEDWMKPFSGLNIERTHTRVG